MKVRACIRGRRASDHRASHSPHRACLGQAPSRRRSPTSARGAAGIDAWHARSCSHWRLWVPPWPLIRQASSARRRTRPSRPPGPPPARPGPLQRPPSTLRGRRWRRPTSKQADCRRRWWRRSTRPAARPRSLRRACAKRRSGRPPRRAKKAAMPHVRLRTPAHKRPRHPARRWTGPSRWRTTFATSARRRPATPWRPPSDPCGAPSRQRFRPRAPWTARLHRQNGRTTPARAAPGTGRSERIGKPIRPPPSPPPLAALHGPAPHASRAPTRCRPRTAWCQQGRRRSPRDSNPRRGERHPAVAAGVTTGNRRARAGLAAAVDRRLETQRRDPVASTLKRAGVRGRTRASIDEPQAPARHMRRRWHPVGHDAGHRTIAHERKRR